jgi:dTDP-4-dehydrorhamnose reductase
MQRCSVVFHLAASVDFWADEKTLWKYHVTGTENVLKAARSAGVEKLVYLSAAAVVMNGKPIEQADESFRSDYLADGYSRTKLAAEKRVLQANSARLKTGSIRPPIIWGKGNTSALPQMKAAALKGQLAFINGGKHRIVKGHVKNVCHALILTAEQNVGGEVFFITDGEQPVFKEFIRDLLTSQGIRTPDRSAPLGVARPLAVVWRTFGLQGHPPLYPGMVNTLGQLIIGHSSDSIFCYAPGNRISQTFSQSGPQQFVVITFTRHTLKGLLSEATLEKVLLKRGGFLFFADATAGQPGAHGSGGGTQSPAKRLGTTDPLRPGGQNPAPETGSRASRGKPNRAPADGRMPGRYVPAQSH